MITTDITLIETLKITISSMLIVFVVLLILMFMVSLFKYIPEVEAITKKYGKKNKRTYVNFENMDEDMKVAVLVATITCKQELQSDIVLKSVKQL